MQMQINFTGASILIVEDSPEMISILASILPKNIKRRVAINGKLAIEILKNTTEVPDLILLDVKMPQMDGYEVCKWIKTRARLRDVPVIFISSLGDTLDKVEAFKIGAADYITKPFQKEEVIARINTHLELSQSRKIIKDLYSQTMQGTIEAMSDVLAVANPEVSKTADVMKLYSEKIMKELLITDVWDLKLACVLSGLGMLSLGSQKSDASIEEDMKKTYDSLALR